MRGMERRSELATIGLDLVTEHQRPAGRFLLDGPELTIQRVGKNARRLVKVSLAI